MTPYNMGDLITTLNGNNDLMSNHLAVLVIVHIRRPDIISNNVSWKGTLNDRCMGIRVIHAFVGFYLNIAIVDIPLSI